MVSDGTIEARMRGVDFDTAAVGSRKGPEPREAVPALVGLVRR
jgi:hypothetical protein